MDFKRRWCILLTTTSTFFGFVVWIQLSKCPDCVECAGLLQSEQKIMKNSSKKDDEQTELLTQDCILKTPTPLSRNVYDCITWEMVHNNTSTNFELIPLNVSSREVGEAALARKKTFQKIFDKRDWPADDPSYGGLKASGPGAMIRNAQGAVAALHSVITKLKLDLCKPVISILDVPCGDLQWMSRFLLTRMDIEYTGADIVPDIIKHHRRKFRHFKNADFIESDIVSSPLNRSYDLIFSRNLLQHLWMSDALGVLQKFSDSGSRYLLTTTFSDTDENVDVEKEGLGSRKSNYNLEIPPFSIGPPICSSYDWSVEHLNLWHLPLMQKKLGSNI